MKTEDKETNRVLPQPCQSGDKVALIAPASPFQQKWLDEGCHLLRSWGLEPVYSKGLFERWGYLSGRDQTRHEALVESFLDDEIKAILVARGGYGTSRLVADLPYDELAQHPKRFLGFSDITLLHQVFEQRLKMISFHAPMVASSLFIEGTAASHERVRLALFAETIEEIAPPIPMEVLQSPPSLGKIRGRLRGGNLSLVVSTLGTPWQIEAEGTLLFLEEVGEPPYRIDRMFQQLRHSGILGKISGLILGDFGPLKDQYQTYLERDFWLEWVGLPEDLPVFYRCPCGHIRDNFTLPIGAWAEMDLMEKFLRFSSH